jgi:hypothetical protein
VPTQFDPSARRIILDTASISANQIWTDWVNWAALADNSKWPPAFLQVGGDSLGAGLFIPVYQFLLNGWRVRPMEVNHTLVITGNLFVDGGGVPVVPTLGNFNVSAQYTVPVQAQGIATGGSTMTPADVWAHILSGTDAGARLVRLLDLAEADEELSATTATLKRRGTNDILLQKDVTGGTITTVTLNE